MQDASTLDWIREKYRGVESLLNERARRHWAGAEARSMGWGGSNSSRTRRWKVVLQELADDLGLRLTVCHFPPGTSKWNKIEHRMFCHMTRNWRGRPLTSHAAIVQLIGNTTTNTGLRIRSELDDGTYPTKETVTPERLNRVNLRPATFHGEWNYSIASDV